MIALIALLVAASVLLALVPFLDRLGFLADGPLARFARRTEDRLARLDDPALAKNFGRLRASACGGLAVLGVALGTSADSRLGLAALLALVGYLGADRFLALQVERRRRALADQLPDMMGAIASLVRGGQSVPQALEAVAPQLDPPLGPGLSAAVQELRIGSPLDRVLSSWADREADDDLRLFATALIIQRQTGGNLAEVLGNLVDTMRERRRIGGQIRSLTAQGRMSGAILAALPAVLFGVLYLVDPARMGLMFTHPLGLAMLGGSAVMLAAGSLLIRRIVAIDV